jgi:WD40 repeat protein
VSRLEIAPYRGLTPFEDSELDVLFFFGRNREHELIVANLMASRLTVLYGETGVGKSSLLRAGVAHHLRGLDERLAVVVFDDWRDEPAGALARAAAKAADTEVVGSLADTLERCSALVDGEIYLILDGLEEYFLYHEGEDGPGRFATEFPEAIRRPGLRASFLLSLREDALAKLDRFKGRIPNLFGNYLRLEHLDREAARSAIVGPLERHAELVGSDERIEIEPELVEAVLDEVAAGRVGVGRAGQGVVEDVGDQGRVETPYLQLVMQRIWDEEHQEGSRMLRLATFRALGGAEQIVRDHLQLALETLDSAQQDLVAEAFDHLVTPSGTKIAHAVPDLARYAGVEERQLQPVLQSLAEERIVRPVADDGGTPRYEIYHDVLADAVLSWRTQHEADRRLQLERAAAERRHRRLLVVLGIAAALLALMAGVTVFALTQRSDARSQARKAHARELDATALSELATDPQHSLRLAVQAAMLQGTAQSEDVLRRSLLASRLRDVLHAGKPVIAAVYSRDGRRILTASFDGRARIYDARTHRLLKTFVHGAPITGAAWSGDGRLVVTGGDDGVARIWDADSGRMLRAVRHGLPIRSVSIDRAGSVVATTAGRAATLWQVGTGAHVATVPMAKPVTSAEFSPDGSLVGVVGNDDEALLVDTRRGRIVRRLNHGDRITSTAFSSGGKLLVTTGADGTTQVWDVRTGKRVRKLRADADEALDAAFSPRGTLLATVYSDGTGRVWNLGSGGLVSTLVGHTNPVTGVTFSPNGYYVVTSSTDRTARVWKAETGDELAVLRGHAEAVRNAVFSPDGKSVLTASDDDTARIWDPATQPRLRLLAREAGPVTASFVGRGDTVLVAGPGRHVALVRSTNGVTVRSFPAAGVVTGAAASPDGTIVAVATGRRVALVRASDGTQVGVFRQPSLVAASAFSPDGKQVTTAGSDGVARIWTVEGRLLRELKDHEKALTDVAFSPDGDRLATGSKDATAQVWDARTGVLLHTLRGHTDDVTSVVFSPDGRLVLTASLDHDARLWDAGSGKLLQKLRWHFGRVSDASFSPDGRWIVTAGPSTAQLWQPGFQDPLLPFGLGGHVKPLTSAVFDPSSRVVLSASQDGTVRTYRCAICGGIDELLPLARARLAQTTNEGGASR